MTEEWRDRPGDSGARFTVPNHPVVDVNWYEALAFCRWLTERLRASTGSSRRREENLTSGENGTSLPRLPHGQEIRLPSEAEWEKAVRGGKKVPANSIIRSLAEGLVAPTQLDLKDNDQPERKHPWEGDLDPNRANYAATEIGATSATGCFPGGASPYGVEDLSGNVWEWCENWYDEKEKQYRVLRGGSWGSDDPEFLSCWFRFIDSPDSRIHFVGFRCVVVLGDSAPG